MLWRNSSVFCPDTGQTTKNDHQMSNFMINDGEHQKTEPAVQQKRLPYLQEIVNLNPDDAAAELAVLSSGRDGFMRSLSCQSLRH